MSNMIEYAID